MKKKTETSARDRAAKGTATNNSPARKQAAKPATTHKKAAPINPLPEGKRTPKAKAHADAGRKPAAKTDGGYPLRSATRPGPGEVHEKPRRQGEDQGKPWQREKRVTNEAHGQARHGAERATKEAHGQARQGSEPTSKEVHGQARHGAERGTKEGHGQGRQGAERGTREGHGQARHGAERGSKEDQKPKLRSGQTVELQIVSSNDDGFGVATHEGTRVLVAGGIPGEVLVGRVTYVGRREAFANPLKFLKTSPDREPRPACSMGRNCDGCPMIQMRYPAQLAWKKNLVTKELRKFPSLADVTIHDTVASPNQLHYRNTAKLVVSGKHSDPVIGIYRRNTHDVLEIADCPLHHPLINKVVKAAKAGIKKGKVQIYNPKSEMGLLRYLVVRVAEPGDRVMVVFVTSEQGYNEVHHLAKYVQQEVPEVAVVAQNINSSTGNVIFGHKDRFLTKAQSLRAFVGDKSFNLSPHSFFQVNSGAARIIYEKVRELAALTGRERVIDVYCGIGGISLYLAEKAREVVGIEFVEAAVADATENAAINHAENCRFEAGDAAHLIDEIGEEGGADVIVLNPPRKGCDERVLRSVAAIKPAKIIYVSCSPETLSRDLDILSRLGYKTKEVQPVDMFPQTVHVEDVALIERVEQ